MGLVHDVLVAPFGVPAMQRALVEVVLLGVAGAVVGVHVVLRRLAFLTDALQHTVFPGIVVAFLLGQSLVWGAVAAAALTIVALGAARRSKVGDDAVLALLTSGFFALGVVLVSRSGGYQHDLTTLLFGRVLGVDRAQLVQTAAIATAVVVALGALHKELVMRAFDEAHARSAGYRVVLLDLLLNAAVAAVVIAAVRAVGTVLLVALVVTPAAAGRLACARPSVMMAFAAAMTGLCGWLGLGVSYELSVERSVDVAPGATVVVCITVGFVVIAAAATLARRARGALRWAR